jgi:RHS repeat-associated protein
MSRRTNETRSSTGARFLFTGRDWLAELGLYDYRNRVYSPDLARFLQTDPIRFSAGDVNLYRYVGNNPINRWYSMGLSQESEKNSTEKNWPRPPGPGLRPKPGPSYDKGRSTTLFATGNEPPSSANQSTRADSYGELNLGFTTNYLIGFQGGLQFNQSGLYSFAGPSFGSPGICGHFHAVSGSISEGWGPLTISGGIVIGGQYTPSNGAWGIGMSWPGIRVSKSFTFPIIKTNSGAK